MLGLGRIFDMLGYLCIYDGDYEVTYSEFDGDNLILKLKLPCTLPQEFSNGNTDFYLTGKDEEINLIIKTTDGKLKQYYADYKDYYYPVSYTHLDVYKRQALPAVASARGRI